MPPWLLNLVYRISEPSKCILPIKLAVLKSVLHKSHSRKETTALSVNLHLKKFALRKLQFWKV